MIWPDYDEINKQKGILIEENNTWNGTKSSWYMSLTNMISTLVSNEYQY